MALVRQGGGSPYMRVTARGITGYVSMDCDVYSLWKAITGCV